MKERVDAQGMMERLLKIDAALRNVLLVIGAILVIFKITEKKEPETKTSEEGFQIKEFDDIW